MSFHTLNTTDQPITLVFRRPAPSTCFLPRQINKVPQFQYSDHPVRLGLRRAWISDHVVSVVRQRADGVLIGMGLALVWPSTAASSGLLELFFSRRSYGPVRFRETLSPKQADWVLMESPAPVGPSSARGCDREECAT